MNKILIVDDDEEIVSFLEVVLQQKNYQVITACNGQEGLKKAKENIPNLALVDIMMPIMNGFETIENIRKQEKWKDLPIIAVTAKALEEDRKKCLEVGANDYMTKPVDYTVLMKLIKKNLQKQKA